MSNGGGAGAGSAGFHVGVVVVSAADAFDPNDVIAKLNAAATPAAATLLKVMTLPLSAPVARSACPIWCADTQSPLSARRASRETTAEPITDTVGVGSTQSSPDCTFISRKRRANRRTSDAAVAKVSRHRQRAGDFIRLRGGASLGTASRMTDTTPGAAAI
jgi:hypothetical protein